MSMLLFIPVLALFAAVVFGVFMALRKQGTDDKGDFAMKTIYIYVVLFATLMMTIGGGIGVFMALSDLVSPPGGYYQTFDQYKNEQKMMVPKENGGAQPEARSDSELRASYDSMMKDQQARTRQNAVNSLIKSLGFILIPLPVFLYYQRRLKTL